MYTTAVAKLFLISDNRMPSLSFAVFSLFLLFLSSRVWCLDLCAFLVRHSVRYGVYRSVPRGWLYSNALGNLDLSRCAMAMGVPLPKICPTDRHADKAKDPRPTMHLTGIPVLFVLIFNWNFYPKPPTTSLIQAHSVFWVVSTRDVMLGDDSSTRKPSEDFNPVDRVGQKWNFEIYIFRFCWHMFDVQWMLPFIRCRAFFSVSSVLPRKTLCLIKKLFPALSLSLSLVGLPCPPQSPYYDERQPGKVD